MKNRFIALVFVSLISVLYVDAQEKNRPDFGKMQQEQKEKLKSEVSLTDAQADSVMVIQQEFRPKMRGLRGLQNQKRTNKMKELNDAMKKRLKEVLKDDTLVDKVIQYQEKQRKEMMEKMREARGNQD